LPWNAVFRAQTTGVGGLSDEALELGQQRADFAQTTFGGTDDVARAVGVVDRGRNAGLLGLEVFARDQACGVIGAGVDLQTGAQALQAGVQRVVVLVQDSLTDQRADVGVYSAHCSVFP
jgi:hypothetical protein